MIYFINFFVKLWEYFNKKWDFFISHNMYLVVIVPLIGKRSIWSPCWSSQSIRIRWSSVPEVGGGRAVAIKIRRLYQSIVWLCFEAHLFLVVSLIYNLLNPLLDLQFKIQSLAAGANLWKCFAVFRYANRRKFEFDSNSRVVNLFFDYEKSKMDRGPFQRAPINAEELKPVRAHRSTVGQSGYLEKLADRWRAWVRSRRSRTVEGTGTIELANAV